MLDGIRDLGNDVYLVNGRVIRIMRGSIDASAEEGQRILIDMAVHIFVSKFTSCAQPETTYQEVYPKIDTPRGMKYSVDHKPFRYLPEPVRAVLRKEFPLYAEQI